MKNLAIIIPNLNGIDWLADCLRAAQTQTVPATIIVVDNGSTDVSCAMITADFPAVTLIQRDKNYGFTGGVNPGIEAALRLGAEAIALLNNDAIPEPDWLEQLVNRLTSNDKIGIVAAKIRHFEDHKLDSTGDFYSTWGYPFPRGRDELDNGQYDDKPQQEIFAASGGASLYRSTMFRQIGLFDQRFFAYFEDVDLSFRARLAGWTVVYEPAAVVRHRIGGTSSRLGLPNRPVTKPKNPTTPSPFARFHTVKNFTYVYTKNMPIRLYVRYAPKFFAGWVLFGVSDIKRGLLLTNLKANVTALVHFPGILIDRWHIQKTRTISDEAIDQLLYHGLPPLQLLRFQRFRKPIKK